MGLPKDAVKRLVEKAYFWGLRYDETQGRLRKYIDHKTPIGAEVLKETIRIHGEFFYVFDTDQAYVVLKTVFRLPSEVRKIALKTKEKKCQITR